MKVDDDNDSWYTMIWLMRAIDRSRAKDDDKR
jgi:hypothetical protein